MDRNLLMWYQCNTVVKVALRKESVDRNVDVLPERDLLRVSLSARRAWIEIFIKREMSLMRPVALRKESVDRNSVRRSNRRPDRVALRKESVDRNPIAAFLLMWWQSRSPQGERG